MAISRPSADSEIRFEVWLPTTKWNGKFLQIGNHGLAGSIPYADMFEPLLRGYAVAATDDGHTGTSVDGLWAIGHPEKLIDFAFRAVHLTAVDSKAMIRLYYGRSPNESYFDGCSEGGREALTEAQRFPEDFQGIIAGAPALDFTGLALRHAQDEHVLASVPGGLPSSSLRLLQSASIAACDALDGVRDGSIGDPARCPFSAMSVQCRTANSSACLDHHQVEIARSIYDPIRSKDGTMLAPGFMPGEEGDSDTWAAWITGENSLGSAFVKGILGGMVFQRVTWSIGDFDMERDRKFIAAKLHVVDAMNPDLHRYQLAGGKLIQYHGWGDAAIPPEVSIRYADAVRSRVHGSDSFYRLFMVQGMGHCTGGRGPNIFGNGLYANKPNANNDVIVALDRWVTHGSSPKSMVATGEGKSMQENATRRLCPYPLQASYAGKGNIRDANSFTCSAR